MGEDLYGIIEEKEAEMTHTKSGNSSGMWLAFQTYYD
jgi:hypothetical protein